MNVELVSTTQPAPRLYEKGIQTAEDLMVYVARVSAPTNQLKTETGPRLLRYCLREGHWSVFQQADMCLEVETSRGIAAQILRHQFHVQEFSQRYAKADLGYEIYEARRQDQKNRQNSIADMSEEDQDWFRQAQMNVQVYSDGLYEEALERGIAKEQARFLLPLGVKTRMYLKNTVRGWIHYIEARDKKKGTQQEHADIAGACKDLFGQVFPITYEAVWGNP